jgi:hypothetical protein
MSPLDAPVRRGRWVIWFHDEDSNRNPLVVAWLLGAMQVVPEQIQILRALIRFSLTREGL